MAIKFDKPVEKPIDVDALKNKFTVLQIQARGFMNSYKLMKQKERMQKLTELSQGFNALIKNVETFRSQPITNTGVKFSLEAFRQTFNAFMPRWKKFEAEMTGSLKE